ncbi:hypothetical protein VOLCADRAFT_107851 [Volvox carteri f. nagariensis]|uniref:N-acetyltransferase domain-containing protein n=1 Tax=Volvox carteri f. nagariensis TaxID=3068 RepID=D8UGV1_VOLCA|nr:uncharacterized protein VOLCADRAFT_107851 [Volvox carteri f. nagariensis]EFJ41015.1 hypothetical protein VOLCADRAFT_107851 [Volvox carteri f. nagariensis]|eukprot:XP_002957879.1 hypothetical protein VOLCADRAFT_107851 [Volvox carteri f. nagariensis]
MDAPQSHHMVPGPTAAPETPSTRNTATGCNSKVVSNSSVSSGASSSGAIHIRPAELVDYWPAADLHCRVFNAAGDVGGDDDVFKDLSLLVDRIMALQINDKLAREGGGNSVLLLAFEGGAPSTPEQAAAAEAVFSAAQARAQAAQMTRGSPLNASFPQPMWWLGRALAPGVRPGVGVSAQSIRLVGVAAVDSFGDLVPPRELNWRTDGQMGWYRREGYAYVSNVAVAPAARRRGVARGLMAAAEGMAAEWGCRAVGLHCNPKKREPWALYRSLGYRDSGVVEPAFMPYLQGRPPDRRRGAIRPPYGAEGDCVGATTPQPLHPGMALH